jgi:hypothetical protein
MTASQPPPPAPGVTFLPFAPAARDRACSGIAYDTVRGRGNFDDGHPNEYPPDRPELPKSTSLPDQGGKPGQRGRRAQFRPRRGASETSSSSEQSFYDAGPDSAPTAARGGRFRDGRPQPGGPQSLRGASRAAPGRQARGGGWGWRQSG